jgi:hypothetical protein
MYATQPSETPGSFQVAAHQATTRIVLKATLFDTASYYGIYRIYPSHISRDLT